ncbi:MULTISPECIES: recombinase family protein [unclassified Mucilaginibacter]|uniref:recombinase family protein n=1 Tax=unclassified Mucilaginibacter TaxID=2617802 RepID=UPI00339A03EC
MKIADLYIRVSTDEQADKGYSQRSQEEVLLKYCEISKIQVRKVIFEDHSAKTFIRPEWIKLLSTLRQYKNKTNLVLFTKWDRFSRNAPDAYQMIATLKKLGVEPQAIEQPLDMEVPENKMMLAIYLTAPEIENDRRALNVFYGMRRARKEGRYMATAPVGYKNRTLDGGRKTIVPHEPAASVLQWAFDELSIGQNTVVEIYRQAKVKGLPCSKNNFWHALRNPVYIGKIVIPQLKEEESYMVDGLHEPLIKPGVFYEVQDVLEGRKRKLKTKIVTQDMLALKGFITCPTCGKVLTGSASKGRTAHYHYYHCNSTCGYRTRAEEANSIFEKHLKDYVLNPDAAELFKSVILDVYKNEHQTTGSSRKQYIDRITALNNKITKARELLLNDDIEASDFRAVKVEADREIMVLESKISDLRTNQMSVSEMEKTLDSAMEKLTCLNTIYCKSDHYEKRKLIGSIYPEKFTFEDLKVRTAKTGEVFEFIYLINRELWGKKNGTTTRNSVLSHRVIPIGFEPMTYRLEICCSIQLSYVLKPIFSFVAEKCTKSAPNVSHSIRFH